MPADSKMMFVQRLLYLACLFLTVRVLADTSPSPALADYDPSFGKTYFALRLRREGAAAAPSISTRRQLDTDGGGSSALCLLRIWTQAYDGVVALQDGSGRLLFWRRNGEIWLAQVDVNSTGGSGLLSVGDNPLIDLSSRVSQQDAAAGGRGLAGVAVDSSGLLLVSYYTTDGSSSSSSALLVVDQVPLPAASSWSQGINEDTLTQVFSMAAAEAGSSSSSFPIDYYSGQILFRPTTTDPCLYLVTGPAPAQTDGQLQAQILCLLPSGNGGTGTPMEAQVYIMDLGIPRRCAFDSDRPQDLYCAIVMNGQEKVYLFSDTPSSPWLFLTTNQQPTPPSLVGGLLYRGDADTTLTGSYTYMDRSKFWVVPPASNHSATRNIRVTCSASTANASPPCDGGGDFAGGVITSFGEDAKKNALLLATDGVYMVVEPSRCDAAAKAAPTTSTTKNHPNWGKVIGAIIGALVVALGVGGGGFMVYRNNCCNCCNTIIRPASKSKSKSKSKSETSTRGDGRSHA